MTTTARQINPFFGWMIFSVIAIAGLFYVKWFPYYNRAFVAAAHHSIGASIIMGKADSPPSPSIGAALSYAAAYGKAIWQAMVLGLLLGSAIQTLLPANFIAKILGGAGLRPVTLGGLLAVPGMMCTCCAAPVVVGLRERQATSGAAIAFWLGNPVLNPATLVFMGFVLGWNWAALRLVLGLLMVFGVGYLVDEMITPKEAETARLRLAKFDEEPAPQISFKRWIEILWRMTVQLVPEYVVIVLLLGAARAWMFPHVGPEVGNSLVWIIGLAITGTIFVIPTAGEVPIVQAMLSLGMGVGPAAALLMTLPSISAPSLAMLVRSFQGRVLAIVTVAVIAFGVIGGVCAVKLGFDSKTPLSILQGHPADAIKR